MFEPGKIYRFTTLQTGDNWEGRWSTYEIANVYEVVGLDGTCVKCLRPKRHQPAESKFGNLVSTEKQDEPEYETIINTASLFFVRAERIDGKDE
jgi:hypothetical protein